MRPPPPQHGDNRLKDALVHVTRRFQAENPHQPCTVAICARCRAGGNTRTVLHYDPFLVTMIKGEGACFSNMDGHDYVEFLNEYSAGLYGHSNQIIQDALKEAIDVIEANKQELAAVLIEPMMAAAGCLMAGSDFLSALRASTKRHGIILIFDEVLTSCSSSGGAANLLSFAQPNTSAICWLAGLERTVSGCNSSN